MHAGVPQGTFLFLPNCLGFKSTLPLEKDQVHQGSRSWSREVKSALHYTTNYFQYHRDTNVLRLRVGGWVLLEVGTAFLGGKGCGCRCPMLAFSLSAKDAEDGTAGQWLFSRGLFLQQRRMRQEAGLSDPTRPTQERRRKREMKREKRATAPRGRKKEAGVKPAPIHGHPFTGKAQPCYADTGAPTSYMWRSVILS